MSNYDMFLTIDGLKGESKDGSLSESIKIENFKFKVVQPVNQHASNGGGVGRVNAHDIEVIKKVDKSSPVFTRDCCTGKHYNKASIIVRKAGDKPLEYYKINMKDGVMISSVSQDSSGGNEILETITLNYGEIEKVYTLQEKDGSAGAQITHGFNIRSNNVA